jgi:hypothetical protein
VHPGNVPSAVVSDVTERPLKELRARVPQHVVYRTFPAETVALDLDTGMYHGLNAVAGQMLRALESAPTVREALLQLLKQFPDVARERIAEDLYSLCRELAGRGLLVLEAPGSTSGSR